jgi:hypothetical protein
MRADEEGTLRRLEHYRDIIHRLIERMIEGLVKAGLAVAAG